MAKSKEIVEAVALLTAEFDDLRVDEIRLDMWKRKLASFPDGVVLRAAEAHITGSKFKPQLADIIERCRAQVTGGWLGADEAWSRMPKTESESAMLTNEISEALGVASPLLEVGEKNAARMAFRDCYNRLVERAKAEGRMPVYFASFGTDAAGRVSVLAKAVTEGQLTIDRATELLPEYASDVVRLAGVKNHPLLAGPSETGKAAIKALLNEVRALK